MKIGRRLTQADARMDPGAVSQLARWLDVTPRTIRNWRTRARREEKRSIGRPRYPEELRARARALVEHELVRQGYPGWRPIAQALPELPVRLVQTWVAQIKCRRRVGVRRRRREQRIETRVLAKEAIWTMDGTSLGRKVEAQVIKDRGSLAYRAVREGKTAKSKEVTALLGEQKSLPLVLATDNGAIYCSRETQSFLESQRVVHLRSLPRTPEHNGAVEVSIRLLKEAALMSQRTLEEAANRINENRLLGTKGFKSSRRLDDELDVAYTKVSRDEFYAKCQSRIKRVAESSLKWREKRRAEREVIFRTLEEYKLIERTRGNRPYVCANVEIFL